MALTTRSLRAMAKFAGGIPQHQLRLAAFAVLQIVGMGRIDRLRGGAGIWLLRHRTGRG